MKNIPIGQHLIEKGLITEEQLQQVLAKQKESKGKMFGDVILEMKLVTENQFSEVLAERLNIPFVDLDKAVLIPDVVKRIPEDTARKYNCIALNKVGRRLTVATSEPSNFYAMEDLRVVTGCSINFSMATKGAVNRAIGKMYSAGQTDSIVEEATKQKEEEKSLEDLANEASNDRIDNAPIVKLASTIVADSFRKEATDIHIEPFRDFTKIRIRVNGDLIELMTLSSALHVALVTRFKILSGMNIAEKRIPQDGRMSQVVDGTNLDLRVSNLPMVYGEKVVIRILATGDMSVRKITDLGMTEYNYQRFAACLKVPQGVVLVTGPTGSGRGLKPGAIQVILPDWFPVNDREAVRFLTTMAEQADGIPLVLYNPPHAKRELTPAEWATLKRHVPGLIGVKTNDRNSSPEWYGQVALHAAGLAVFVPGHHLATGVRLGAAGAYSNVACLNPFAAQRWYELMLTDMTAALELEGRIQQFMERCITPFIVRMKYPNHACDRFMALVGGWADVGSTLRWPYDSIPDSRVEEVRRQARQIIPEFFNL